MQERRSMLLFVRSDSAEVLEEELQAVPLQLEDS